MKRVLVYSENAPRYVISYDVANEGGGKARRRKLRSALMEAGATRLLKSQWGLRRKGTTANALVKEFGKHLSGKDKLLVTRIGRNDHYAADNVTTEW